VLTGQIYKICPYMDLNMVVLVLDSIQFQCISAAFPNVFLLYLIWFWLFGKPCGIYALTLG